MAIKLCIPQIAFMFALLVHNMQFKTDMNRNHKIRAILCLRSVFVLFTEKFRKESNIISFNINLKNRTEPLFQR